LANEEAKRITKVANRERMFILAWGNWFGYIMTEMRITKARKYENTNRRMERDVSHQFEELSSRILAAAVDVHKTLGPGFLESIYQKAMEVALQHRGIPFSRQSEVVVIFEGVNVGTHRLDLIADAQIIVELKAVKAFEDIHSAQLRSYLK